MVFFTCNSCGSSLKKNQVEKHYKFQCRSCEVLTCVDCHKDFPGDSYIEHTKCITEAEKYSAKGWQPKPGANKGERKQLEWIDNLNRLVESQPDMDADVKNLLSVIMNHENIPRKKQKFTNFVKNIMRKNTMPSTIDKTWDLFEEALKKKKPAEEPADKDAIMIDAEAPVEKKPEVNDDDAVESRMGVKMFPGTTAVLNRGNGKKKTNSDFEDVQLTPKTEKKKKKKKKENVENGAVNGTGQKRKREEEEEEEDTSPKQMKLEEPQKFDWEITISKLLKKKGSMPIKRLKKKVLTEYKSRIDSHKSDEELSAKLEKKLRKNKQFKVLKETVSLATK